MARENDHGRIPSERDMIAVCEGRAQVRQAENGSRFIVAVLMA